MSEKKSPVKAGLWYTIANFLTKGATFLTTPIFTRIMSAADVGAFANINSWFQVLMPLLTVELSTSLSLARFDYSGDLDRYTSSVLVIGSGITALFYMIVLLNMDLFKNIFSMEAYAIHLIFCYLMVYPALQMFQSRNMFEFRYKTSTAVSISSLFLSVVTSLVLTLCSGNKLLARAMGYYVPAIFFCASVYLYIVIRGKGVSLKYLKYAFRISLPMIWHTLAMHLLGTGDRLVIKRLLGSETTALYTVAFTTSMISNVLWNAMNNAWSPWSAAKMNSGDTAQIRKASHAYILAYAAVILGMLLISPEILLLMGGKKYAEAVYVLPPVIVGCFSQFLYSLYVNAEFYLKKQTRIAIGTLLAAGLNIGLNFIFIPKYGYVAAAYTTLAGYLSLLLFHYGSLRSLHKADWYDNRFNFLMMFAYLMLVPLSNYLYGHTALRYGLIAVLAAVCIAFMIRFRAVIRGFLRTHIFSK